VTRKLPWIVFGLMLLSAIFFVTRTAPGLPPMVASHFDLAGYANAFMTRSRYVHWMLVLGVGLPIAIVALLTFVYRRANDMKLPNRDYWLAPERIEATRNRLVAHGVWLGSLLVAMSCFVHWLELGAHRHVPPHLSNASSAAGLLVFFLVAGAWILALLRTFRRPRGA
jgi:uncharacterized membrane protein